MNPFIEKLKTLILNEVQQATFGELPTGAYSVRGSTSGREPTFHPTPTTADKAVAANTKRKFGELAAGDENDETAEEDTENWTTTLSKKNFKNLEEKLGGVSAPMWLDDNTAMFLNNLFDKFFGKDKEGNEIIQNVTVSFSSTTNSVHKDKIENLADLSHANEFLGKHQKLLNFLTNDARFPPRFYKIELKIPVDKYQNEDLAEICKNLNVNFSQIGITSDDIAKEVTITINVTSTSTLVNLFSHDVDEKFSVATTVNALKKFCWMVKRARNIFATNTGEKAKKFMTPSSFGGIQYSPEDILGAVWTDSNSRLVRNTIYCFIDSLNGSYIYIPGYGNTEETLMVIPQITEVKTWEDKIYETFNQYINGIISLDALKKVLDRFSNLPDSKRESEVSWVNDRINSLVYKFVSRDTSDPAADKNSIIQKAEQLKSEIEDILLNLDMQIVDEHGNVIPLPYESILTTIDSAIDAFNINEKDSTNFNAAIEKIKSSTAQQLSLMRTNIDDFKKLFTTLGRKGGTFKVFRFMYQNSVDMDYSIDIPGDIASKIMGAENVDEAVGVKVSCSRHPGNQKWLTKFGFDLLKKYLEEENITDDPKQWLKDNYICDTCIEAAAPDEKTKRILTKIYPHISDELILQSVSLKRANSAKGLVVPGAQNLPRTSTNLIRKIEIDPNTNAKSIKYMLVTNAENVAKQPSGSLYGIKYDSVPYDFKRLSVSDSITDIIGLRKILGELIDDFYFMPDENQIEALKNNQVVKDEKTGEEFSINNSNVKYAIDSIKGTNQTLIFRSVPKKYIEDGDTVESKFGEKSLTNEQLVDLIFSDYYDGLCYFRNQMEIFMEKNNIKISDTGKNANQLRKSGRPGTANTVIKDITNDIKGGQNHKLMFNMQLSKVLSADRLKGKIIAFLNYKQKEMMDSITEEDKQRFSTVTIQILKDETPIDSANFAGDKLFVSNERDAWLNGNESPLIPFLMSYLDSDANASLEEAIHKSFAKPLSKNQDTGILVMFYKYICELCGYVNNFNKLLISDGHRARIYDKRSTRLTQPILTKIETGIPTAFIDEKPPAGDMETSKNNVIKKAPAAHLNSGFIVDDLISDEFRPVVHEISDAINSLSEIRQEIMEDTPGMSIKQPIGFTGTDSEIPHSPYHTIVFSTTEDDKIVINILSSCAAANGDDDGEDFKYDENNDYVAYTGDVDAIDQSLVTLAAKKVVRADLGYNAVYVSKENYFSEFVKDFIYNMISNSQDFFYRLRALVSAKITAHYDWATMYVNCVRDLKTKEARDQNQAMMSKISDDIFNEIKQDTSIDFDSYLNGIYRLFLMLAILEK